MIGIIMAGGLGSRLYPTTNGISKQLLPIFDKPMIYYPLTTLMFAGIREYVIIVSPESLSHYKQILGDGSQWGVVFNYIVQEQPKGIADCFNLVPKHLTSQTCLVILGDNIFYGTGFGRSLKFEFSGNGALAYAYEVSNPADYGVVQLDELGNPICIVEKPKDFLSKYAIPGLYWFDSDCFEKVKKIQYSNRHELEITDILNLYLKEKKLTIKIIPRGTAWLDTGNSHNLLAASNFVSVIEDRQGLKIGCPEEVAFREKLISFSQLKVLINQMPPGTYRNYLEKIQ